MSGPVRQYAVHQLWRNATTAESLQVVVVEGGRYVRSFPLREEMASTEWLGGIAFLSAQPTLTLQLPAPLRDLICCNVLPCGPLHLAHSSGRGTWRNAYPSVAPTSVILFDWKAFPLLPLI